MTRLTLTSSRCFYLLSDIISGVRFVPLLVSLFLRTSNDRREAAASICCRRCVVRDFAIVCEQQRFSFIFIVFCRNENADENQRVISVCLCAALRLTHAIYQDYIEIYEKHSFILWLPKQKSSKG